MLFGHPYFLRPARYRPSIRQWMELLGLLCLLSLALIASPVYAQSNLGDTPASEASLAEARARLDDVRKALDASAQQTLSDTALRSLRDTAQAIQDEALRQAADVEPERDRLRDQLNELGEPTDEPTTADVVADRTQLQAALADIDARAKRARLLATEANQTVATISKLRRSQFQAELGQRSAPLLSIRLLNDIRSQLPADSRRLSTFVKELSDALSRVDWGSWLGVVLAWAVLIGARRGLAIILRHATATHIAPGRLRRSSYALIQVVLTSTAAGLALYAVDQALVWQGGLTPRVDQFVGGLVWLAAFIGFVVSLGNALLSCVRPAWRLATVSDDIANRLRWLPAMLGITVGASWLAQRVGAAIDASLTWTVVQNCVSAIVLMAIFAIALRSGQHAREDSIERGMPVPALPLLYAFLRVIIWCAIGFSLVCLLLGYVALASFVIRQVTWLAIILAASYLIDTFLREGTIAVLAAARQDDDRGQNPALLRARDQIIVLTSGFLRLAAILIAVVVLVAPYGDGPAAWLQRLRYLDNGIHIGEAHIRPASILMALVVFTVGVAITKVVQGWLAKSYLPTTRLDAGMRSSVATLLGYVGYIWAFSLALSALGVGLERVTWIASALSVGIGFGMQAIVQNFVSGLILLAERPVKVGDWVSLGTVEGDIRRINVRATEIEMSDRSTVVVPNSELITKIVRNVTHANPMGRVYIKYTLPKTVDTVWARDLMLDILRTNANILTAPAPDVLLDAISIDGPVYVMKGFVKNPRVVDSVRSEILLSLTQRLRQAGEGPISPPPAAPPASDASSSSGKQTPGSPAPNKG